MLSMSTHAQLNEAFIGEAQNVAVDKQHPPAAPLPILREELKLLAAATGHDGSPAWMIQDPINNRFYKIGWLDFELLSRWHYASPQQIIAAVHAETTLSMDMDDIHALVNFLHQHHLVQATDSVQVNRLIQRANAEKPSPLRWLLHHYLFFRVPLVRPQVWLAKLLSYVHWIYTPTVAWLVVAATLSGLFLVARQWDVFSATFVDQLSWQGVFGFTLALITAKTLHEMGHALTATRYGVRVAHMGVAFLVMFPMLYTDTSESWKLSNPKQRLAIASAGIVTELALAGLATLAWALSPDGTFKSALFYLATTSWMLTLVINASPFMRFDGYFILSDLLDLPNLHARSGALAQTWLRRTLLGFDDVYTEHFPSKTNKMLIAFAITTWLYRLVLYLGIAALVYVYFFKLLGLCLMAVELFWFVWKPLVAELSVWKTRHGEIKAHRAIGLSMLVLGLLIIGFIPFQHSVHGSAWVHAAQQHTVYSPLPGRIVSIAQAGAVASGQALFVLESPDLTVSANKATMQAKTREQELVGLMGRADGEESRAQLQLQQAQFLAENNMYRDDISRLHIGAPFAGQLMDIDPLLAAGVWVKPNQPLGVVIDPKHWLADVFVPEEEVKRIAVGNNVTLHQPQSIEVESGKVIDIDQTKTVALPHPILDAKTGGDIVTLDMQQLEHQAIQKLIPRDPLYRVRVALDAPPQPLHMTTRNAVIEGERSAWLPAVFKRIAAVVVRESGF